MQLNNYHKFPFLRQVAVLLHDSTKLDDGIDYWNSDKFVYSKQEQLGLLYMLYLVNDADYIDIIKFIAEYLAIFKYQKITKNKIVMLMLKAFTIKVRQLIFMMYYYWCEEPSNLVCTSKLYNQMLVPKLL